MDISKWPSRIVTALLLASFILGYTLVESSNYYDFTQSCTCGSQAVYHSEKTPYLVQQLIPAALVSAAVVLAAIGHPLLGVMALAILFSMIGSMQIQNNVFQQSYAGQPHSPHYEYMQSLGSLKLRFGIMWGLIGIFSGIGLYVTRNWTNWFPDLESPLKSNMHWDAATDDGTYQIEVDANPVFRRFSIYVNGKVAPYTRHGKEYRFAFGSNRGVISTQSTFSAFAYQLFVNNKSQGEWDQKLPGWYAINFIIFIIGMFLIAQIQPSTEWFLRVTRNEAITQGIFHSFLGGLIMMVGIWLSAGLALDNKRPALERLLTCVIIGLLFMLLALGAALLMRSAL